MDFPFIPGEIFNLESEFSEFVDEFATLETEKVVIKGNFSCFSSTDFTEHLSERKNSEIIIIGYGSGMCCLSTIIDGYHRGFNMTFVKDASAANAKSFDEVSTHAHMSDALTAFAKVVVADEIA